MVASSNAVKFNGLQCLVSFGTEAVYNYVINSCLTAFKQAMLSCAVSVCYECNSTIGLNWVLVL